MKDGRTLDVLEFGTTRVEEEHFTETFLPLSRCDCPSLSKKMKRTV